MFKSKLLHLAVSVLMSFEIESWEIYRRAREKHIAIINYAFSLGTLPYLLLYY